MNKLTKKTVNGMIWSFIERFGFLVLQFLTNLFLARILSPDDFGQIGLLMVFVALSLTFIDGGLGAALVQKKSTSKSDYSTVFTVNFALAIVLYCLIFYTAPFISVFFKVGEIESLLKVIGVILIIDSIGIVQHNILLKKLHFKKLAKIKITSAFISCFFALILAYNGVGVWSLVYQYIINSFTRTLLLLIGTSWKPHFQISKNSLDDLFGYGWKLLAARFLSELYIHLQSLIIGRIFTPADLGFYSQAKQLQQIPVQSLGTVVNNVTFPVFSNIQDNTIKVREGLKKTLKSVVFINFPLMVFLALVADPLFTLLYTEKWSESVPYFQVLCVGFGMFLIVHSVNLSLIKSLGRSDWILKLEIIKKITGVILIIIGIKFFGIMGMLYALALNSILEIFLNGHYTNKLINYSTKSQIIDFGPTLLVSLFSGVSSWFILFKILLDHNFYVLIFVGLCFLLTYLFLAYLFKIEALFYFKKILVNRLRI